MAITNNKSPANNLLTLFPDIVGTGEVPVGLPPVIVVVVGLGLPLVIVVAVGVGSIY